MSIDSVFTPAPPSADPLAFSDTLQVPGVYGAGSDDAVSYTIGGVAFDVGTDQQFLPGEGQRFRKLNGELVITID